MGKRLSKRRLEQALDALLPHKNLVTVEPYLGGGADGRAYGSPVTLSRCQIVDSEELVRDQYDAEAISTAKVYFERAQLVALPVPETKFVLRVGTADEREAFVMKSARYEHPDIADIVEVTLR